VHFASGESHRLVVLVKQLHGAIVTRIGCAFRGFGRIRALNLRAGEIDDICVALRRAEPIGTAVLISLLRALSSLSLLSLSLRSLSSLNLRRVRLLHSLSLWSLKLRRVRLCHLSLCSLTL